MIALPPLNLVSVVACEWAVLARYLMSLAVPSCFFPLVRCPRWWSWGLGGSSCRLVAAFELGARFAPSILHLRYQSQKMSKGRTSLCPLSAGAEISGDGLKAPSTYQGREPMGAGVVFEEENARTCFEDSQMGVTHRIHCIIRDGMYIYLFIYLLFCLFS